MSGHGLDIAACGSGMAERALRAINRLILFCASIALICASVVLSYSVIARTLFKVATYWQDEAAVFLLVGATFLSAAGVQEKRGHIGIEAIVGLLPAGVNCIRVLLVDVVTLMFCSFFAWKSWTLLTEAWIDGQVTASTWAPSLWIPYSLMTAGMALLSLQVLVQILAKPAAKP